jgi:hypothetical protein
LLIILLHSLLSTWKWTQTNPISNSNKQLTNCFFSVIIINKLSTREKELKSRTSHHQSNIYQEPQRALPCRERLMLALRGNHNIVFEAVARYERKQEIKAENLSKQTKINYCEKLLKFKSDSLLMLRKQLVLMPLNANEGLLE